MNSLTPSHDERRLLRGLAANSPDPDGWWSRDALAKAFPADFGHLTPHQVAAAGRALARHGFAFSRTRRTHARQWQEWRIRSAGFGLVSDSCIGGGLEWDLSGGVRRCPACLSTPALTAGSSPWNRLGDPVIPAHPLPGHFAPQPPLSPTALRALSGA
jgi:hypothetical protein